MYICIYSFTTDYMFMYPYTDVYYIHAYIWVYVSCSIASNEKPKVQIVSGHLNLWSAPGSITDYTEKWVQCSTLST